MNRLIRFCLGAVTLCAAGAAGVAIAGYGRRDALAAVVTGCALNYHLSGKAFPCLAVHPGRDDPAYALLRPLGNRYEVLLTATVAIPGIESLAIRPGNGSAFWQDAWLARDYVAAAIGRRDMPRDSVALALNSAPARSQDRMHIHIDCLGAANREAFVRQRAAITEAWSEFPEKLEGRLFWVRSVAGADLTDINPIALMLDGIPVAADDPASMTLAVIGATLADGRPGFYLVAETATPAIDDGTGSAEDLLDHACRGY